MGFPQRSGPAGQNGEDDRADDGSRPERGERDQRDGHAFTPILAKNNREPRKLIASKVETGIG